MRYKINMHAAASGCKILNGLRPTKALFQVRTVHAAGNKKSSRVDQYGFCLVKATCDAHNSAIVDDERSLAFNITRRTHVTYVT